MEDAVAWFRLDIKSDDGKEKLEMQWNAKGDTTKMVGG
jgi:hypothetical protein